MVLENQPLPFLEWFLWSRTSPGAMLYWVICVAAVALGALVISFLVTAAVHGPNKGGDIIFRSLVTGLSDLVRISPRRVFALARLAVQESIRRQIVAGIIIFAVVLAFAGWFLNAGDTADPAKVYISFILSTTKGLVLVLAVLLSAFSLPADIQRRTIFTIVTKPVRPSEIVLGRTLGFAAIGTCLLVLMGAGSSLFLSRTLSHRHMLTEGGLAPIESTTMGAAPGQKQGRTSLARGHRHEVTLDATGHGATDVVQNHWHEVTSVEHDGKVVYELGPPLGEFNAREPVYGKLQFRDRAGKPAREGINVGNEWTYRSYVEGGTPAAAIWRFQNLRPEDYPEGLPMELTIRVFRTHKGEVDKGILGSITLRNPKNPDVSSNFRTFLAKEYSIDQHVIPLTFQDDTGRTVDLFKDLVADGELDVQLKCLQRAQFFGMAQPDLYLLPREGSFWLNFLKGHISTWLQMVLLITFGVMWSTFLNGPVAMLATGSTLVFGYFIELMQKLAADAQLGGGPLEQFIRIGKQENPLQELPSSVAYTFATSVDQISRVPLFVVSHLLPDFRAMDDVNYVASGFDVPADLLCAHVVTALGYVVPVLIAGLFMFKVREVGK